FTLLGAAASVRVHLPEGAELPPPYALVAVEGRWQGAALEASALRVVGGPLDGAPNAEGDLVFFQRRGRAAALCQRAGALAAIRAYFDAEGFLEVDTPTVVPSPGVEVHLSAFAVDEGGYLNTSPEYQMKRLLSAGFSR